jgi:L-ascorbate metabolism protein UlaG (beta-lactamase superfamily)
MEITWHGYSCFTIKSKGTTTVVNPYKSDLGLKLPELKGDIAIVTNAVEEYNNLEAVNGEPHIIDWPGEYEIGGVAITALKEPDGKGNIFTLIGDNLKVCMIENVGKDLNDEFIDKIGDVDILLVAVGGNNVMKAEIAHKVIEEIEPRAVIPMHYAVKGAKAELDGLEPFWKLVGVTDAQPQETFILQSRSSLQEDKTEYVLLNPQVG